MQPPDDTPSPSPIPVDRYVPPTVPVEHDVAMPPRPAPGPAARTAPRIRGQTVLERLEIYPYRELRVNDSFFVPLDGVRTIDQLRAMLTALNRSVERLFRVVAQQERKHVTKALPAMSGKPPGIRVWRVQ